MAKKRKPEERNWIFIDCIKNFAIRINYIKAKIDNAQKNCKWHKRNARLDTTRWECAQGNVQEINIWPCWLMIFAQIRICHRKWDAQNSIDPNGSSRKRLDLVLINKRCPWCNCYRRRKRTRRHEFKSWTKLIAFHIALIPLGKVWIQLFSLQLWVNSRAD